MSIAIYPVPMLAATAGIEIRESVGPHLIRATTLIKLLGRKHYVHVGQHLASETGGSDRKD
jgi:hypothetical protein